MILQIRVGVSVFAPRNHRHCVKAAFVLIPFNVRIKKPSSTRRKCVAGRRGPRGRAPGPCCHSPSAHARRVP